ncbi:MAG: tRNA (N6-threonylcarbamoyladenosine(37)-N6)-methyltransferase TrmO [Ignavibacteria bacterium]
MQDNDMVIKPIGYFHCSVDAKHRIPRQPDTELGIDGIIKLEKGYDFEQALTDLQMFTHIWVIYGFHEAKGWKPMVLPPRGEKKRGVFATRSPYRPNSIGISVLNIKSITGLNIAVSGTDLLDKTPVFDIKPYIPYADARHDANAGWLDTLNHIETEIMLSEVLSQTQNDEEVAEIIKHAEQILRDSAKPHPYRRIKHIEDDLYELAIKEWRLYYRIINERCVRIESISQPGSMK